MRVTASALLLAYVALPIAAQDFHAFSNGEVADADKINETHQYILNNAGGGCSVTQNGNTVIISCSDGTVGVLAGDGTVATTYVYPESGDSEPIVFQSGDIVAVDGNGVELAVVRSFFEPIARIQVSAGLIRGEASLVNREDEDSVYFGLAANAGLEMYYTNTTCSGAPITSGGVACKR